MQRIAVIINPTAGRGAAGRRAGELRDYLMNSPVCAAEFFTTQAPGDALRFAEAAACAGCNIIAAVGGDGTLHEAVNALMRCDGDLPVLGLIPFGTGNDFARGVGLNAGIKTSLETLVHGCAHAIDIGLIESPSLPQPTYFLAAAGVGFVADTAKTVNEGVKGLSGTAAYLYGAVATLRRFLPEYVRVKIDGRTAFEGESTLISVSNVATTGGGIRIAPGAKPDDGVLDVCIVSKVSKSKILAMLPRAFPGDHVRDRAVSMMRGRRIEIETMQPCALWIDGEVVGATPATFTLLPSALKMMLPPARVQKRLK